MKEKEAWERFQHALLELKHVQINCCVLTDFNEVHSFSDASKDAYCAVIYIRYVVDANDIKVALLFSKLLVATIPLLERCTA